MVAIATIVNTGTMENVVKHDHGNQKDHSNVSNQSNHDKFSNQITRCMSRSRTSMQKIQDLEQHVFEAQ